MILEVKKYLLGHADQMTAWIGCIGLCLLFVGWTSALFILFVALVMFPDAKFSGIFAGWTKKLREIDAK